MATRARPRVTRPADEPYEFTLSRRPGDEAGEWVAQVAELPGCDARGATEDEALANVRQSMAEWIDRAVEEGRPVPPPKAAAAHSGRLLVRMPPSLHSELARLADREKVSLNTLIVGVLGGATSWRQPGQAPPAGDAGGPAGPDAARAGRRARLLSYALVANVVVLVVAAALAVVLLVTALTG